MAINYKNKTYKVVICTPAGRKKYLDVFKRFIYRKMNDGLIDGWQLWLNTVDKEDIEYLYSMEKENSKVKVYTLDEEITPTWETYNALQTYKFFKYAHDDDTIYIRFDDDIIWCEEGAIEKICQARIDNPKAYVIYPNIINSTICTSFHQENGALSEEFGRVERYDKSKPDLAYLDSFNYSDSKLIEHIHNTFKKRYEEKTLDAYYLPSREFSDYERFSICCVAWWGKDKITPGEIEEPQIAYQIPQELERPNFFVGDALMVHYSYHTQRRHLTENGDKPLEFFKKITL